VIIGGLALFLNFFAAATLAFFFGVAAVSAAGLFRTPWQSIDASGRRRLLWVAVSTPWLLALGVSVFFLLSLSVDVPWVGQLVHWHHVNAFNFYSWHAYPSLLLLLMFVAIAVKTYRSAASHLRAYGLLKLALNDEQLLESQVPQAFSAGFLVPEVFISTGLIDQLEKHELQIVQHHEQAHVNRRDSLKKLIFSFLSSFFLLRVAQPMRQAMSLCMEQCADECAVSGGTDRADVAMTLLKVTKLMRAYGARGDTASLTCAFGDSEVKARVTYLILPQPARSIPLVLMMALLSAIALLCLLSVDTVHHVIETLFTH
tara:strand:+ start:308 stop:1252 length:945 start_codon:yes stop_codon:yes gene_type:complete